jgi:hypothetical protein
MRRALRPFLMRICADRLGPVLVAMLIALTALQSAVPVGPALANCGHRQTEEEDSEPTESSQSGEEQCLPEFAGPAAHRQRRPRADHLAQPFVMLRRQRRGITATRHCVPAELAGRNGIGAPLRC